MLSRFNVEKKVLFYFIGLGCTLDPGKIIDFQGHISVSGSHGDTQFLKPKSVLDPTVLVFLRE